MALIGSITLNIKTISESNCNQHWAKQWKRHKQQQLFVRLAFMDFKGIVPLPCRVVLTRLSKRFLDDDDNLPTAFKYIKDQIAALLVCSGKPLGHDDSDPRIKWEFKQEKRNIQGIRIEIFSS